LNFEQLDWRTLLLAGAAVLLAAGGIVAWWRRRPQDPEEIERRRRSYLNQVGRIVEGQVLEIIEAPALPAAAGNGKRRGPRVAPAGEAKRNVVYYSYSISGVSYETAQDITGLEERACLTRLATGLPVSVKYDPANPGNSILVADDWSGVH
jgi:hypothetical protein